MWHCYNLLIHSSYPPVGKIVFRQKYKTFKLVLNLQAFSSHPSLYSNIAHILLSLLFQCFLWKLNLSYRILLCNKEVISRSRLCCGRKTYWCHPHVSKRAFLKFIFTRMTWENTPNALLWRVVSATLLRVSSLSCDIYCAREVYQDAWIFHFDF